MQRAVPQSPFYPERRFSKLRFLGIDFGWVSQPSGVCCLDWQAGELHLLTLERCTDLPQVLDWVDQWLPPDRPGGVAVDAPTVIANATGMRPCDRQAHRYFGKYDAGCYPANLSLPFASRTLALGLALEARGFAHAPTIQPQHPQRYQIEVFPHPAMVHLFQLDRILKYKKGRLAERQRQLAQLRQHLAYDLSQHSPPLCWERSAVSALPPIPTGGRALKALEDQLDALTCAYVAAHWWAWGLARNRVLGDRTSGYIIVPDPFGRCQFSSE